MIHLLLITALTVSIDSFVCGFSLSLTSNKKIPIAIIITMTVFIMCLFTNYLAVFFSDALNERTVALGGFLLVAVGLYNLLKKEDETKVIDNRIVKQSFLVGVAVGLDGALANLSLSLMGMNAFYVPCIIALMHGAMVYMAITLSNNRLISLFNNLGNFSPLVLIGLGVYKVITIFI